MKRSVFLITVARRCGVAQMSLMVGVWLGWVPRCASAVLPEPAVEVEEKVYDFKPADNGAGPLWCHGSTCLARFGERVCASGIETLAEGKPLNNCRWLLFERGSAGWRLMQKDEEGRTREPCPLAIYSDGRLFLSASPTLAPAAYSGPARPEIFEFPTVSLAGGGRRLVPEWAGQPAFTEHSYRSFAADGPAHELILFQNIGYTHAEWCFRQSNGTWAARGQLHWPAGAEYEKPQPVRVCYPTVALANRAVHFCGVSDIIEPNSQWRAYKKQLTGREWDYDFRRLFYCWNPDITREAFQGWIEIASREKTCGWIMPLDLWVAPGGLVHLLWAERAIDERLREKFFPEARQSHALNYAVIKAGTVISRRTLAEAQEGKSRLVPSFGRFHVTPENRLVVVFYVNGADAKGAAVSENRVMEVRSDGSPSESIRLNLKHPLSQFFTATVRAGSAPSQVIDLLGQPADQPNVIAYARVRLR
jgi:hypothetical protein